MKITEVTLEEPTLSAYFKLIETHADYNDTFRGQANSSWPLIPKLYRCTPLVDLGNIERSFDLFEYKLVEEFFSQGMPFLQNAKRGFIADRIIAQHYGVPTRLLDWTDNPLVALFFAVQDGRPEKNKTRFLNNSNEKGTDAVVFVIRIKDFIYSRDLYTDEHNIHVYGSDIMRNHKILAIRPPVADLRIMAQKSIFTIQIWEKSDDNQFLPLDQRENITCKDDTSNCFTKIVIPSSMKKTLYIQLFSIGIAEGAIFPNLEGIGQQINSTTGFWDKPLTEKDLYNIR